MNFVPNHLRRQSLLLSLFLVFVISGIGGAVFFQSHATAAQVAAGDLVKASGPSVYYVAQNGKRYGFPNEKTYFSWYTNFSSVKTISSTELASYPLGGNVTYRPGVRLLKVQSDPKVYAVDGPNVLRWIKTEAVAIALYGNGWKAMVDDLPDSFFVNYVIGTDVVSATSFVPSTVTAAYPTIQSVISGLPVIPQSTNTNTNTNTNTPVTNTNTNTNTSTNTGGVLSSTAPKIGNCQIYPSDNPWNADVSNYPVDSDSGNIIGQLAKTWGMALYTIKPYNVVDSSQAKVPIHYTLYGATSDPGPMPIPSNASYMIKAPGLNSLGQPKKLDDNHLMVLDKDACKVYELWSINGANPDGSWDAGSGSIYDLTTNALRPFNAAASAASGLPVFAGIVRADEVQAGAVNHAIAITTTYTRTGYILPATTSQPAFGTGGEWNNPYNPVMGMRLRLKKSYDISNLPPQSKIIAQALQTKGMFIIDGSPGAGQMAGDPNAFWDYQDLQALKAIPANAFEVLSTGAILP